MQSSLIGQILLLCKNKDEQAIDSLFDVMLNPSEDILSSRPSLVSARNTFKFTGNISNALATSLLITGRDHAPIVEIYELIEKLIEEEFDKVKNYVIFELSSNRKIPGFGNPVIKGYDYNRCGVLSRYENFLSYKVLAKYISETLNDAGKPVYDNIAFWVAAYAHYLGIKKELSPMLFIVPNIFLILKQANI